MEDRKRLEPTDFIVKLTIGLFLLPPFALAQDSAITMPTGAPKMWAPTTGTFWFHYELAEPAGWIDLQFSQARDISRTYVTRGNLIFRGVEPVPLPGWLLSCLPAPRLGDTLLQTIYIAPEANEHWFDLFGTQIAIAYGRGTWDEDTQTNVFNEYPNLSLDFLGNALRRAVLVESPSQRTVLDLTMEHCPLELIRPPPPIGDGRLPDRDRFSVRP